MTPRIITGCSSFNESYWKGVFYPTDLPRKEWFAYYCQNFNTYELNGTFYRFPTAKSLSDWYGKSTDGFQFSVKMYKGVTHFKKFQDCEEMIAQFYALCREQLKDKLAYILFQLPPSFSYSTERLALVLDSLDSGFRNVVEFRHSTWWCEEVYEAFQKKGVTMCSVSYPGLPQTIVKTTDHGYLRFHGVPKLFYSEYGKHELDQWRDSLLAQKYEDVFVYFNNTASTAGIMDALLFNKMIGRNV